MQLVPTYAHHKNHHHKCLPRHLSLSWSDGCDWVLVPSGEYKGFPENSHMESLCQLDYQISQLSININFET